MLQTICWIMVKLTDRSLTEGYITNWNNCSRFKYYLTELSQQKWSVCILQTWSFLLIILLVILLVLAYNFSSFKDFIVSFHLHDNPWGRRAQLILFFFFFLSLKLRTIPRESGDLLKFRCFVIYRTGSLKQAFWYLLHSYTYCLSSLWLPIAYWAKWQARGFKAREYFRKLCIRYIFDDFPL